MSSLPSFVASPSLILSLSFFVSLPTSFSTSTISSSSSSSTTSSRIQSKAPTIVYLKCVKEGGKLRVKIASSGYLHDANCQFPRDIRKEGVTYTIPSQYITLCKRSNKWFYQCNHRQQITIINENSPQAESKVDLSQIKIFEDTESLECVICYADKKEIVFDPCGHFYTCVSCSQKIKVCPICRANINNRINRSDFSSGE